MKKQIDTKTYLSNLKNIIQKLVKTSFEDKVMLYAAQAAYFVIVSAIPFMCLLISIVSFLIPEDIYKVIDSYPMPQEIENVVRVVIQQLLATQKVSLLSLSAIIALWTASRGSDAIRAGIENVYEVPPSNKFVKQQVVSVVNTFILIIIIIANIVFVLFGDLIVSTLHLTKIIDMVMNFGIIILFVVMCLVFAVIYASNAKHSINEKICSKTMNHLPGAVFATVGWILFSFFYSLYIKYFPSASAIYGSLTAVCLIMLWLYVCIVILLLGAEINKLWNMREENHNI